MMRSRLTSEITKGFWMGQTEVTVGAYKRFAAATGRPMPIPPFDTDWETENMPIVNVTWDDVTAITARGREGGCPRRRSGNTLRGPGAPRCDTGQSMRLPGITHNSGGETHEVGQKRANGFGLYDMLGNVWEWVNDWYAENYYHHSPSQDPTGPASGEWRVLRGGSWDDDRSYVRVSHRVGGNPLNEGVGDHGFRCVGEVFAP